MWIFMLLNKKDIVRINEEIGETGGFGNEGSLDYVIIKSPGCTN